MPDVWVEAADAALEQKTQPQTQQVDLENLSRAVGENARLQSELNQAFAKHLLEFRNTLQAVQQSITNLGRRIDESTILSALSSSVRPSLQSNVRGDQPNASQVKPNSNGSATATGIAGDADSAQRRAEQLRAEVAQIKWWHSIDLGYGVVTPGAYDTRTLLDRLAMPADLRGQTVLDIGAWDGYLSFAAERRGAARVLATDSYVWQNNIASGKRGFQFARKTLGSKVEDMDIDIMDLSPEKVGVFDVVLFSGVLYHLRHPLLALERVRKVTKKLLIMETHVDVPQIQRPVMAFYPGAEANNDATNWWGPNEACCIEMLKTVGFRNIKVAGRLPAAPISSAEQISYGRTTFHAEV